MSSNSSNVWLLNYEIVIVNYILIILNSPYLFSVRKDVNFLQWTSSYFFNKAFSFHSKATSSLRHLTWLKGNQWNVRGFTSQPNHQFQHHDKENWNIIDYLMSIVVRLSCLSSSSLLCGRECGKGTKARVTGKVGWHQVLWWLSGSKFNRTHEAFVHLIRIMKCWTQG